MCWNKFISTNFNVFTQNMVENRIWLKIVEIRWKRWNELMKCVENWNNQFISTHFYFILTHLNNYISALSTIFIDFQPYSGNKYVEILWNKSLFQHEIRWILFINSTGSRTGSSTPGWQVGRPSRWGDGSSEEQRRSAGTWRAGEGMGMGSGEQSLRIAYYKNVDIPECMSFEQGIWVAVAIE